MKSADQQEGCIVPAGWQGGQERYFVVEGEGVGDPALGDLARGDLITAVAGSRSLGLSASARFTSVLPAAA